MPIHPSSEWILDPALPDKARVIIAVLQRYGAHNRPTIIRRTELFDWFAKADADDALAAWKVLAAAGAVTCTAAGPDHLTVSVVKREAPVERPRQSAPPPTPPPPDAKKPGRKRPSLKVVH